MPKTPEIAHAHAHAHAYCVLGQSQVFLGRFGMKEGSKQLKPHIKWTVCIYMTATDEF
jgi:hypothetical protein